MPRKASHHVPAADSRQKTLIVNFTKLLFAKKQFGLMPQVHMKLIPVLVVQLNVSANTDCVMKNN